MGLRQTQQNPSDMILSWTRGLNHGADGIPFSSNVVQAQSRSTPLDEMGEHNTPLGTRKGSSNRRGVSELCVYKCMCNK